MEDVGICVGIALEQALGAKAGIVRYGSALVPMDEALVQVALDLSGRPFLAWSVDLPPVAIGTFDALLAVEFFQALASNGRLTLHVTKLAGNNPHHVVEACFKAVARALDQATGFDPAVTRGALDQGRPQGVRESSVARLTLIDYGSGNLRSVQKAFEHVGARAELTTDPEEVLRAEALVLPGVGLRPRHAGTGGPRTGRAHPRPGAGGRALPGCLPWPAAPLRRQRGDPGVDGLGSCPGRWSACRDT